MTRSIPSPILSGYLLSVLLALAPLFAHASQFYNDWAATNFNGIPAQSGSTNDPDGDGDANLVEFAFGTDPRSPGGINGSMYSAGSAANIAAGNLTVGILERAGHQPGAQIDLYLSASLTNWFRPWWLRIATNSQPLDPPGSIRESFTTSLPATNSWFARSGVQLIEAGAETAKYCVATNGSDSAAGTSTNTPFKTLSKAVGLANPGDLIYVRAGTYLPTAQVSLSRNGSATQPIRIRAYPGEHPVLDFSGEPAASAGISLSGNSWWLYGLEVVNAGHNGIKVTGSSNTVERCVVHASGDTGIHLTTCSYNLILNCDSYRNYDPPIGGNADGFGAKFVMGPGNVFRGCRSWNNSDDGWDFWQATNAIVLDHCMTWSNGFNVFDAPNTNFDGNGNGFKLGGDYLFGPHIVTHCVSFGNAVNGFDQNNNNAGQTVDHCTAWANGSRNFQLNHGTNITPHVVRNNLSFGAPIADSFRTGTHATNNSWQVISGPAANAGDVLSVDPTLASLPRRDDGSLPETPFLRPVPNGRLVNQGINLGQPFSGNAPDLGAYESPEW